MGRRMRLWPTAEELRRMVRHPSAYAPTAAEVLTPDRVPPLVVSMSADERRLMDAILADPDADAPRLRYANWVEAMDPERAAFIRGQVTGFPQVQNDDIPQRWLDPFLPFGARDVVFRRGFAEAMSLTGRSFVSLSDGLFAATPLREVRLIAVNFLMAELVHCPNLTKLRVLNLRGNRIGDAGAGPLAGCEHLSNLARLDVTDNGLTPAGEQALVKSFGPRVLLR
ncbi:MAG: TIGR02996 domain-containing protein [Gemmataceae bacterium]